MDAIPTWVFTVVTLILIFSTIIVAYQTQGGIKRPYQLFTLTLITILFIFTLTFLRGVTPLLGLDLKGGVSVVLEAKGNPTDESVELASDIIRSRVDALGVAEPEISPQGNNIIVDIPGVKDARKIQELIGQTAELRFREVAENQSTDPQLAQVLTAISIKERERLGLNDQDETTTTTQPKESTSSVSTSTSSSTSTTVSGSPGKSFRNASSSTTTSTSSTTTTTTPAVTSVTLQCGGVTASTVTLEGDLTKATPREEDIAEKPIISVDKQGIAYALCPTILKGNIVKSAQRNVDINGDVSVGVELTNSGSSQFTSKIGSPLSGQRVAIVLDSTVISAPTIESSLANGLSNNQLQITVGSENQSDEVDELVTVLKYGKLPVVLEAQTAQKVSATLGTDQLHAGLLAGAIGLILVLIYMLLYYRILALVVTTGLVLTGMTTYALICWLGQTRGLSLTLAGAVGLIVSLGVTVDSYVVYFEKLKDEVRQGRTLRSCLDTGFKSSFRTILAADLVSLIGAAALFWLASGSVRGFAFFLGLSTVLDLLISVCFMHPMVKMLSQSPRLISHKWFGFAAALDKKDLTA